MSCQGELCHSSSFYFKFSKPLIKHPPSSLFSTHPVIRFHTGAPEKTISSNAGIEYFYSFVAEEAFGRDFIKEPHTAYMTPAHMQSINALELPRIIEQMYCFEWDYGGVGGGGAY